MKNLIFEAVEYFDNQIEALDLNKVCVKEANKERFKAMKITRIYINAMKEINFLFSANKDYSLSEYQDAMMILFCRYNDQMDLINNRTRDYYESEIDRLLEELKDEV